MDDAQVVAACDVDQGHLAEARAKIDAHYGRRFGKNYQACAVTGDFRELVNRGDLDVICNATPDHWHVIPSIMAAKAGKDVICEKPLTLFVAEGRELCNVMGRTGRIFQTASENRSIDSYIHLVELVRAGRIGSLRHIKVTLPRGNDERGKSFTRRDPQPPPKTLDFEMWLGQAPKRPYVPALCHESFRWCSDYSGGRLTDWGAHLIDLAQWGNDTEQTGPVEVEGVGTYPPPESVFNTAYEFNLDYKYANGVTMNVSSSEPGIRFEGSDGWIGFTGWRTPLQASDKSILDRGSPQASSFIGQVSWCRERAGSAASTATLSTASNHDSPCYAPAETGHRTATIAHLGNIAMQLGRKLRWDPAAERFVDDAEADAKLSRVQRGTVDDSECRPLDQQEFLKARSFTGDGTFSLEADHPS